MPPENFQSPRSANYPEEYRILESEWPKIKEALRKNGKNGPQKDGKGGETRGDYQIKERNEIVGIAQEAVVILRTDDEQVKELLGQMQEESQKDELPPVTPEPPRLPRLSRNAIRCLGPIKHYTEYDAALVAPMRAKDVRKAFERYNKEYAELNDFRRPSLRFSEILEKRHYTLREMEDKDSGEIHTMLSPSKNPQRRKEFERAISSGKVHLGAAYSYISPKEEQRQLPKKKLRR